MHKETLILRANISQQKFVSLFIGLLFFIASLIFALLGLINGDKEGALIFAGFGLFQLLIIFFIYIIVRVANKTYLQIDNERIVKKKVTSKKEKVLWDLRWEEIDKIGYQKLKWWHIFNLFYHSMEIGIKTKTVVKKQEWHDDYQYFCNITYEEALQIKEHFCPQLNIL